MSFIGTLDILEGNEYLLDVFVILGKPKNIPLVVRIIVSSVIKVTLRRKHIEDKQQYSLVSIFNIQYVLWSGWWRRLNRGDFLDFISTLLPSFHLLMFCLQKYSISRIVNYIQDKQINIYSQKSDHMVCHDEFYEKYDWEKWEFNKMKIRLEWWSIDIKGKQVGESHSQDRRNYIQECKQDENNSLASHRMPVFIWNSFMTK